MNGSFRDRKRLNHLVKITEPAGDGNRTSLQQSRLLASSPSCLLIYLLRRRTVFGRKLPEASMHLERVLHSKQSRTCSGEPFGAFVSFASLHFTLAVSKGSPGFGSVRASVTPHACRAEPCLQVCVHGPLLLSMPLQKSMPTSSLLGSFAIRFGGSFHCAFIVPLLYLC